MEIEIYADGGARGNPGPAATGFVIFHKKDGKILEKVGQFVGEKLTNNQAEYQAVVGALKTAKKYSPTRITVFLDSQLLVEQLSWRYRVKSPRLKKLHQEVLDASQDFPVVEFKHIPREKNSQADALVNEVLDNKIPK